MMELKFLNSKEAKRIRKTLSEQFGFTGELDYIFLQNTKDRLYILSKDSADTDFDRLRIDAIGLYFATIMKDGMRMTIEGSQIIGSHSNKNILELKELAFEMWLKGENIHVESELDGYVLVKHKEDFVGCGKIVNGVLLNYVPKNRRLQTVNN